MSLSGLLLPPPPHPDFRGVFCRNFGQSRKWAATSATIFSNSETPSTASSTESAALVMSMISLSEETCTTGPAAGLRARCPSSQQARAVVVPELSRLSFCFCKNNSKAALSSAWSDSHDLASARPYSTSPEVQTFTCSDPQKTPKGTNFRKHFLGSFSQTTTQASARRLS